MTTVTTVCGLTLIVTDEIDHLRREALIYDNEGRLTGKIVNIGDAVGSTSELLNLAARAIRVQSCEK